MRISGFNCDEDKIFFNAGDIVELKLDIPNKPRMIVIQKVTSLFKHNSNKTSKKPVLIGIKCRWFTNTGELQEAIFNTKDLILI